MPSENEISMKGDYFLKGHEKESQKHDYQGTGGEGRGDKERNIREENHVLSQEDWYPLEHWCLGYLPECGKETDVEEICLSCSACCSASYCDSWYLRGVAGPLPTR